MLDALAEPHPAAHGKVGLSDGGHQHERPTAWHHVFDALIAAAPFSGVGTPTGGRWDQEFFLRQTIEETALNGGGDVRCKNQLMPNGFMLGGLFLEIVMAEIDFLRSGIAGEGASKQGVDECGVCLLYTSPSPRDQRGSRMPSSA